MQLKIYSAFHSKVLYKHVQKLQNTSYLQYYLQQSTEKSFIEVKLLFDTSWITVTLDDTWTTTTNTHLTPEGVYHCDVPFYCERYC